MGSDQMGLTPGSATVSISNWSLAFSDPHLEHAFKVHQRRVWSSTELWRLKVNLLAGIINLSITSYMLSQGNILSNHQRVYIILLPYMTVAIMHYCLARWQHGTWVCILVNHLGEVCYSLICTLSMPTWVLHGSYLDYKEFARKIILGSGIFIGIWIRFLTPTFFTAACFLTPLQFAFQALYLTHPTCNALVAHSFGEVAMQQLLTNLNGAASWALQGASVRSTHSPADLACGCYKMMYVLQLFAGGTLLYTQYRMERANRQAFLQGKRRLVNGWPWVPPLVQALLHAVVYLQLFGLVWMMAWGGGGGSSMGTPAPNSLQARAPGGVTVLGAGKLLQ